MSGARGKKSLEDKSLRELIVGLEILNNIEDPDNLTDYKHRVDQYENQIRERIENNVNYDDSDLNQVETILEGEVEGDDFPRIYDTLGIQYRN